MEQLTPDLLQSLQTAARDVAAIQDYRGMAIALYCGIAYFCGVLAILAYHQTQPKPPDAPSRITLIIARVMISALMFPVTLPAQAYVVNNPWVGSQYVPFDWLKAFLEGSSPFQLQAFAFGLVALFGAVSYEVFVRIQSTIIAMFSGLFGVKRGV
jgi:hypothetical protein